MTITTGANCWIFRHAADFDYQTTQVITRRHATSVDCYINYLISDSIYPGLTAPADQSRLGAQRFNAARYAHGTISFPNLPNAAAESGLKHLP
jgi:hypothetical protein